MQYFAMTVEEKNELCAKGHKCLGCHRIFDGITPTAAVKWEFELAEEKKDIPVEVIEKKDEAVDKIQTDPGEEQPKKRGNPNWLKRGKKK